MHRSFGRLDREVIHHLNRGRQHSSRDDLAHCGAGFICGVESSKQRLNYFWLLNDPKSDSGCDAQRAFRSNENSRTSRNPGGRVLCRQVHQRSIR